MQAAPQIGNRRSPVDKNQKNQKRQRKRPRQPAIDQPVQKFGSEQMKF